MDSISTHELSEQELNAQCTRKIMELKSYIEHDDHDDDQIQEKRISVYEAIKEKGGGEIKDGFFRTRMKWAVINHQKAGKSVDNGFWKRDSIEIVRTDHLAEKEASVNILKDMRGKPVDEQVIEKITFETFLKSLSEIEKRFVHLRIVDWTYMKIMKKLKLTQEMLAEVQRSVRRKINAAYA